MPLPVRGVRVSIILAVLPALVAGGCGSPRRTGEAGKSSGASHKTAAARPNPSAFNPISRVTVVVNGGMIRENGPHGTVWELRSPTVTLQPGANTGRLTSVDGTFYKDGKPAIHVRAPEVLIDRGKKHLSLTKGIVVTGLVEPEKFTADRLDWQWDQPEGLAAAGNVRLQRGPVSATAGRLVADVALKTARLSENPVVVAPESGVQSIASIQ